jgi:uncharacterized membrane protein required for colicin V production
MNMDTVITIVIGLIVIFFFIDGIRRGLVRQVFEVAGLIAAFIGAYYLGHAFAHRFEGSTRISYPIVRFFFSAVVFIAVALVFHLLGVLLQKIVSVTILGPVDRIGGALFGVVKGVLFVSLVCVLLFSIPAPSGLTARIKANRVAAAMHPVLPRVYNVFMKRSSLPIGTSDFVRAQRPRGTL